MMTLSLAIRRPTTEAFGLRDGVRTASCSETHRQLENLEAENLDFGRRRRRYVSELIPIESLPLDFQLKPKIARFRRFAQDEDKTRTYIRGPTSAAAPPFALP